MEEGAALMWGGNTKSGCCVRHSCDLKGKDTHEFVPETQSLISVENITQET